jgi:hypothetical protein
MGDLPISNDILLVLFDNFIPKLADLNSLKTGADEHSWIEGIANLVILDPIVFFIGMDKPNHMEYINTYLLADQNEIDNYSHIHTFVHYSNHHTNYCRAVYNIHNGNNALAIKYVFKTAAYINKESTKSSKSYSGIKVPWNYLHKTATSNTNNNTVSEYFNCLHTNFSGEHPQFVRDLALSVGELDNINFSCKKKYMSTLVQSLVEEHKSDHAYNSILSFSKTDEKKELYNTLIKSLTKSNQLGQLHSLFCNQDEVVAVILDSIIDFFNLLIADSSTVEKSGKTS